MSEVNSDYLGAGWSFPPTFTKGGAEVVTTSGPENVHKCIRIILETRVGERVLREDFGCALHDYVFEPIAERLVNDLRKVITNAIVLHEPRVKLEKVEGSKQEALRGWLFIQLRYWVKSANSRFNMVYPFDVQNPPKADI